jgi:hypothetical protein
VRRLDVGVAFEIEVECQRVAVVVVIIHHEDAGALSG